MATLDGLRAYAVMLVFCVHFFGHYFLRFKGVDFDSYHYSRAQNISEAVGYYMASSHYGVDLFFLISGFLIFRIVSRADFAYGPFLRNRALRLYPAFAFALAIHIVYAAHFWRKTFDAVTIAQNALFLNGIWELRVAPIIVPTWSLTFEWLFYLLFPMFALAGARRGPLSLGWIGAGALGTVVLAWPIDGNYLRFLMFFVGAALACIPYSNLESWTRGIPDLVVIFVCAAVNLLFVFDRDYYHFIWLFAGSAAFLVAKVIAGRGILSRLFSFGPLQLLGNISYSFFLLHGLAVIVVVDHLRGYMVSVPEPYRIILLMAGALALSTAAATVSYLLFERPYFLRRARSLDEAAAHPAGT